MPLDAHWVLNVGAGALFTAALEVATRILLLELRPDACVGHDVVVVIRAHRLPRGVKLQRSVRVEHVQADREELHDLTGIVLIWGGSLCIEGLAPDESQILAHDWRIGSLAQNVAVVAKRVLDKDIIPKLPDLAVTSAS
eukprot:2817013-Prymnesium_polylepis.1